MCVTLSCWTEAGEGQLSSSACQISREKTEAGVMRETDMSVRESLQCEEKGSSGRRVGRRPGEGRGFNPDHLLVSASSPNHPDCP